MRERLEDGTINQFNKLSGVHLVKITFRKVESKEDGRYIGDVIQFHLIDATDYFVLETWLNSSYARGFFQVMASFEVGHESRWATLQYTRNEKKKAYLNIYQYGEQLPWSYTRDNMQDCPPLDVSTGPGGKTIYNSDLQDAFFLTKLEAVIAELESTPNPFPNHPLFESRSGTAPTESQTVNTAPPAYSEPEEDDLPF
ncbi:hypothetical protein [Arachidicoccus terrestris]|uniref:hypothetical protein n=1 Tax=Arachidicoccus terrestris TaxID=2875539 RepID=UPI001CC816A2|nr:hypothetical protein [Arachidicoccus terrestris]UAY56233.1 hypothetical protein K9M52_04235 [Arachidicoccus terrestris]